MYVIKLRSLVSTSIVLRLKLTHSPFAFATEPEGQHGEPARERADEARRERRHIRRPEGGQRPGHPPMPVRAHPTTRMTFYSRRHPSTTRLRRNGRLRRRRAVASMGNAGLWPVVTRYPSISDARASRLRRRGRSRRRTRWEDAGAHLFFETQFSRSCPCPQADERGGERRAHADGRGLHSSTSELIWSHV